jgi:hypothetical protein
LIDWYIIGIDPAPSKDALVYSQGKWQPLAPGKIRAFVTDCMRGNPATLVAWDAPLSFDPKDLYDRTVDKVVRAWAAAHVRDGRFAHKAINARCFAGLPHWVVSCVTLGLPFGTPPSGLRLADVAPGRAGKAALAIEVHPAVALGAWWLEAHSADPFPRYKGDVSACKRIAKVLGFPPESGTDDDHLDSFVAHRLGELFVLGKAHWLGGASSGGYVMPDCAATTELANELARVVGSTEQVASADRPRD